MVAIVLQAQAAGLVVGRKHVPLGIGDRDDRGAGQSEAVRRVAAGAVYRVGEHRDGAKLDDLAIERAVWPECRRLECGDRQPGQGVAERVRIVQLRPFIGGSVGHERTAAFGLADQASKRPGCLALPAAETSRTSVRLWGPVKPGRTTELFGHSPQVLTCPAWVSAAWVLAVRPP